MSNAKPRRPEGFRAAPRSSVRKWLKRCDCDGLVTSADLPRTGGRRSRSAWPPPPLPIFGVEGDIDATDVKRDFALGFAPGGGVFATGDAFRFKNDWQASVRGRGGFAFGQWLVYATGGVAWGGVRAEAAFGPGTVLGVATPGAFASDRHTLTGATVGGGVEFAFTNNVTLGVE